MTILFNEIKEYFIIYQQIMFCVFIEQLPFLKLRCDVKIGKNIHNMFFEYSHPEYISWKTMLF